MSSCQRVSSGCYGKLAGNVVPERTCCPRHQREGPVTQRWEGLVLSGTTFPVGRYSDCNNEQAEGAGRRNWQKKNVRACSTDNGKFVVLLRPVKEMYKMTLYYRMAWLASRSNKIHDFHSWGAAALI